MQPGYVSEPTIFAWIWGWGVAWGFHEGYTAERLFGDTLKIKYKVF